MMKVLLKTFLGIALFLVVFISYLAYPLNRAVELSDEMINSTIPYEQHPKNPNASILVGGDSTAVGVGTTHSYDSIAGRIGKQFPQASLTNLGVSGARLADLLKVLENEKSRHYDLIVLLIGANDITHFTPYDQVKREIAEVMQISSSLGSKTIILTAGDVGRSRIFYWPLSTWMTDRTLQVRKLFLEEASHHPTVHYVDLFQDLKEAGYPLEKNYAINYAIDSFHLSNQGYGIWYDYVKKSL